MVGRGLCHHRESDEYELALARGKGIDIAHLAAKEVRVRVRVLSYIAMMSEGVMG